MFLGMRGNGDWVSGQRPKNWRQKILKLYPNGQAPLTAMLSMMGSSRVDDPEFNWWTQEQTAVNGDVADIFTIADLSVAYAGGGVFSDGTPETRTAFASPCASSRDANGGACPLRRQG